MIENDSRGGGSSLPRLEEESKGAEGTKPKRGSGDIHIEGVGRQISGDASIFPIDEERKQRKIHEAVRSGQERKKVRNCC